MQRKVYKEFQSFTRPNDVTAYASGDLVANSTSAGSVTPIRMNLDSNGEALIRRLKLHKSGTGTANAQFRVHLFTASPTVANGDNGAFSCDKVADYLGSADITIGQAFTDGAAGFSAPAVGSEFNVKALSQRLYALIEARAAYTPIALEVFTLTAEIQVP